MRSSRCLRVFGRTCCLVLYTWERSIVICYAPSDLLGNKLSSTDLFRLGCISPEETRKITKHGQSLKSHISYIHIFFLYIYININGENNLGCFLDQMSCFTLALVRLEKPSNKFINVLKLKNTKVSICFSMGL